MKILLFGATGSLGKEFKSLFLKENINFNSVNRKKIKNRFSLSSLNSIIKKNKPKLIINCIALTGLIYCQNRRKMAYKVNTQIPFTILKDDKNTINFKPEIRIYNQPVTSTSEADIKTNFFSDNFIVFSLLKDNETFNVRFQYKPFMILIWLSTLTLAIGGMFAAIRK